MNKLFLLALLLSPTFAFAKFTNVLRNFSLAPKGEHFEIALYFEEARPGRPSGNYSANGCGLLIRSKGNFFFTGRYRVSMEEEMTPGSADPRWGRQYTTWASGMDLRVTCRAATPVNDDYVRRVMAGFVRLEP